MLSRLQQADDRYREIEQALTLPDVLREAARYAALMKEYKQLTPVIEGYRAYRAYLAAASDARALMNEAGVDAELRTLA